MFRRIFALVCALALTSEGWAAVTQFPYEAVVRTDNAAVRCGQGKNYYITSQLKKGTHVIVHRHDPGGWSMISPPEGSFSWIAADQVRIDAPGSGTVELPEGDTAGAPVWVGSDQGDEHSVRQRVLRSGDPVQVLGEETLGGRKYLKIAPPHREFRWVKGEFLIPDDPALRQVALNDPYANPLETAASKPAGEIEDHEESESAAPALPRVARESTTQSSAASNDSRAALRELDRHYIEMMSQDPEHWDLDELVKSYQGLASSAPELSGQIQQRVAALEPRRKLFADYKSLLQLSAETTARDQQLASQSTDTPVATAMDFELGNPGQLEPPVQVASTADPNLSESLGSARIDGIPPVPAPLSSSDVQKLDGAGIVQRLNNGQYGITTPSGRVLAVLQADQSLGLDRMIGKPMGFVGNRQFDPAFGTDRIVVRQAIPVQLNH